MSKLFKAFFRCTTFKTTMISSNVVLHLAETNKTNNINIDDLVPRTSPLAPRLETTFLEEQCDLQTKETFLLNLITCQASIVFDISVNLSPMVCDNSLLPACALLYFVIQLNPGLSLDKIILGTSPSPNSFL